MEFHLNSYDKKLKELKQKTLNAVNDFNFDLVKLFAKKTKFLKSIYPALVSPSMKENKLKKACRIIYFLKETADKNIFKDIKIDDFDDLKELKDIDINEDEMVIGIKINPLKYRDSIFTIEVGLIHIDQFILLESNKIRIIDHQNTFDIYLNCDIFIDSDEIHNDEE